MKKFVSKFFTCFLIVVATASMMCSNVFAASSGKSTCAQKGCYRAQDWGSIYCSYHRPKTTSYNYFKKQEDRKNSTSNSSSSKSSYSSSSSKRCML